MKRLGFCLLVMIFSAWPARAAAITAEEILRLKEASLSDETIQWFLRVEMERLQLEQILEQRSIGVETVEGGRGGRKVRMYIREAPAQESEGEGAVEVADPGRPVVILDARHPH
jgi:hypothetical protein